MATLFYVIGIGLVLLALLISLIGMRSESFPSTGVLRAGVALVGLVVLVTAYSAVGSAQDEQSKREAEANGESAAATEQQTATNAEDAGGGPAGVADLPAATGQGDDGAAGGGAPPSAGEGSAPASGQAPASGTQVASGDAQAGAPVFVDTGCGSCHTLAAGGASAVGQIGPNLDEALVDKDPAFIETSIVDPGAYVEDGFGDGIMPQNYADQLSPTDLANLVAYLSESTSGAK